MEPTPPYRAPRNTQVSIATVMPDGTTQFFGYTPNQNQTTGIGIGIEPVIQDLFTQQPNRQQRRNRRNR